MDKIEAHQLIDNDLANDEAGELMAAILCSKINFYNIKNLRAYVQCGTDDLSSYERVAALKNDLQRLHSILAEARASNKKIVICSEVNISIVD